MKITKFSILLCAFVIALTFSANAQSSKGDKDKKKSSNTAQTKTAAEPAKEIVKEPSPEKSTDKSSGIPNTHSMAVPDGQQVEARTTLATPK